MGEGAGAGVLLLVMRPASEFSIRKGDLRQGFNKGWNTCYSFDVKFSSAFCHLLVLQKEWSVCCFMKISHEDRCFLGCRKVKL